MLHPMQDGNEIAPSTSAASFASLLASLTAPRQPAKWSDDDLADDIATLSYENALRAHARYRAPDRTDRSLTQPDPADRIDSYELAPVDETPANNGTSSFAMPRPAADNRQPAGANPPSDFETLAVPVRLRSGQALKSSPATKRVSTRSVEPVSDPITKPVPYNSCDTPSHTRKVFEKNLKDASITIRMSREECDQLHTRAAEAGLTVSAYLRSCTFEVESLRALVKDTMAELKAARSTEKPVSQTPARRSLGGRLSRFITPWRSNRPSARA